MDGGAVAVALIPEAEGAAGLKSVTLSSSEAGAEFCVETCPLGTHLGTATKVGAEGRRAGRFLARPETTEGAMLGGELAILTRDKVYEEAVAACARLLAAPAA